MPLRVVVKRSIAERYSHALYARSRLPTVIVPGVFSYDERNLPRLMFLYAYSQCPRSVRVWFFEFRMKIR
ncbi:hypothetical protein [Streptomyces sp. NPDC005784]|uniref:hypothetical protein n=1 Tax=Streptomyces sp. NPDC005784 TaxID=3364731 RepID=UPI00369DAC24